MASHFRGLPLQHALHLVFCAGVAGREDPWELQSGSLGASWEEQKVPFPPGQEQAVTRSGRWYYGMKGAICWPEGEMEADVPNHKEDLSTWR